MTDESRRTPSAAGTKQRAGLLLSALLLLLGLACRQPTAPLAGCSSTSATTGGLLPVWPATVTGCWLQHGVDTYDEFHLVQQGTVVTGTFNACGPVGGCTHDVVSGTASFPHVVLHWTEVSGQQYNLTFDATLTAARDSLVGNVALNGQPPGPTTAFVRTAAQ